MIFLPKQPHKSLHYNKISTPIFFGVKKIGVSFFQRVLKILLHIIFFYLSQNNYFFLTDFTEYTDYASRVFSPTDNTDLKDFLPSGFNDSLVLDCV